MASSLYTVYIGMMPYVYIIHHCMGHLHPYSSLCEIHIYVKRGYKLIPSQNLDCLLLYRIQLIMSLQWNCDKCAFHIFWMIVWICVVLLQKEDSQDLVMKSVCGLASPGLEITVMKSGANERFMRGLAIHRVSIP